MVMFHARVAAVDRESQVSKARPGAQALLTTATNRLEGAPSPSEDFRSLTDAIDSHSSPL